MNWILSKLSISLILWNQFLLHKQMTYRWSIYDFQDISSWILLFTSSAYYTSFTNVYHYCTYLINFNIISSYEMKLKYQRDLWLQGRKNVYKQRNLLIVGVRKNAKLPFRYAGKWFCVLLSKINKISLTTIIHANEVLWM